jgi:hypothetical protein
MQLLTRAFLIIWAAAPPVHAQPAHGQVDDILTAALAHTLEPHGPPPASDVRIDPRPLPVEWVRHGDEVIGARAPGSPLGDQQPRDPARLARIAGGVAVPGRIEEVWQRCDRAVADCGLRAGSIWIAVSEPRIDGDSAYVRLEKRYESEQRHPGRVGVEVKISTLILERVGGIWRVVDEYINLIS